MHDFHFLHLGSLTCLVHNAKLTFYISMFVALLLKLSPLNALRNYGDRRGKLLHARKDQSHPVASLRSLATKTFLWPIRSMQGIRTLLESKCPGALSVLVVDFHHKYSIVPTSYPWVSEDTINLVTLTNYCQSYASFHGNDSFITADRENKFCGKKS